MHQSSVLLPPFGFAVCLAAVLLLNTPSKAETRVQKTFDQWSVNCTETDKKTCGISFRVVNAKNKQQLLLGWAIVPDRDGTGNIAIVRTPTGMSLPAAISVKFAGSEPVSIVYKTCGPANCMGEVSLNDAWLKALKASTSFAVSYTYVNGKTFEQEINLKGFTDAFNYYTSETQASSGE